MRKELVVAIVLGIFVGLAVAFGIWRVNSALKTSPSRNTLTQNQTQITPIQNQQNDALKITLLKPQEKDVISESPTLITGITKPASWVVISAESEDYIVIADEKGEFEEKVDLDSGVNQILISAFLPDGQKTESKLTVVYSTEYER